MDIGWLRGVTHHSRTSSALGPAVFIPARPLRLEPLLLVLLLPKALRVVALELEQLLEVPNPSASPCYYAHDGGPNAGFSRFAVDLAIQGCVSAQLDPAVALMAAEAGFVEQHPICLQLSTNEL